MRFLAGLAIPAVLLGAIPPILGVPFPQYETGWLGAWGFVELLAILWLVALIPWARAVKTASTMLHQWRTVGVSASQVLAFSVRETTARTRRAIAAAGATKGVRVLGAVVILTLVLGFGLQRAAASLKDESFYQASQTQLARRPLENGPAVFKWAFHRGPMSWTLGGGTHVTTDGGLLNVTTSPRPWASQLVSATLELRPGAYAVLSDASVERGGIAVQVLDWKKQRYVIQGLYSSEQRRTAPNFVDGRIFLPFSVASHTTIRVTLSNWTRVQSSSKWHLRHLSIVRQVKPCGCSPPDSNAWISR
jgi:hypothetical protein